MIGDELRIVAELDAAGERGIVGYDGKGLPGRCGQLGLETGNVGTERRGAGSERAEGKRDQRELDAASEAAEAGWRRSWPGYSECQVRSPARPLNPAQVCQRWNVS